MQPTSNRRNHRQQEEIQSVQTMPDRMRGETMKNKPKKNDFDTIVFKDSINKNHWCR
jgi:hypothetical protein